MSADLRNLIAAWYHHDRIARETVDPKASGATADRALEILFMIADFPATTPDEVLAKLAIAADAFIGSRVTRESFAETCEPAAKFVYPVLIEARRIIATQRDAH